MPRTRSANIRANLEYAYLGLERALDAKDSIKIKQCLEALRCMCNLYEAELNETERRAR